ncbi:MAG: hypothetical protein IIC29_02805, partial [Chloroflexi bacterium]|nr:hypothetical protein [Chloroflexota bacterium]
MIRQHGEVKTDSPAQLRRVVPVSGMRRGPLGPGFVGWSVIALGVLVVASWAWVYHDGGRLADLFSARARDGVLQLVRDLAGAGGDGRPDFLNAG